MVSMPAETAIAASVGREKSIAHLPGHPTAPIRPRPSERMSKNGIDSIVLPPPSFERSKGLQLIERLLLQRIGIHAAASLGIQNRGNAIAGKRKGDVKRLNILEDRRIRFARHS